LFDYSEPIAEDGLAVVAGGPRASGVLAKNYELYEQHRGERKPPGIEQQKANSREENSSHPAA
jgi:aryl-alcohol dehydrogenase-like predicted oxidoreductase